MFHCSYFCEHAGMFIFMSNVVFCFFMDTTADSKSDPVHCDLCGLAEVSESLTGSRDRAEKRCTDVLTRMKKLKKDGGKNTIFKYQIVPA